MNPKSAPPTFCNTPNTITRHAFWLLFFDKSAFDFSQHYSGAYTPLENPLFKIRINDIHSFERQVNLKHKNTLNYYDISLRVRYSCLKIKEIKSLQNKVKTNAYVVALITNEDVTIFGNSREAMSFQLEDKLSDNASADDHFLLTLTGKTSLAPQRQLLQQDEKNRLFKVLLLAPPTL